MSISEEQRYDLDRMNSKSIKHKMGTLIGRNKSSYFGTYDFTKSGGAVGSINLVDRDGLAVILPTGFIIQQVLIDVPVAVTSGGSATVAFKSKTAADLLAATAKTSFSLAALIDGVPVNTAATAIKMTANTTPQITIAVAALTAGRINVHIQGVLSL